jgi:uncharacterized phage-associated protein
MAISAHDVARELRSRLPGAGSVKVQKLLYYCQGWHLTWTDEPMFEGRIEAWGMGPVVADLWHDEDEGRPAPRPTALGPSEQATVAYVVERYGRLTGQDLVRLSHGEDPWLKASTTGGWATDLISHEALRAFFSADEELVMLRASGDRLLASPEIQVLLADAADHIPVPDDPVEIEERMHRLRG